MKRTNHLLLVLLFTLIGTSSAFSQNIGDVVIVEVSSLDTQTNMDIYQLFGADQQVQVINSCEVLGWVVLSVRSDSRMSLEMAKSYVGVKVKELLPADSFQIRNDKNAIDVLEECRAEMSRQLEGDE